MEPALEFPANVARLRRRLNERFAALPAFWSDGEPSRIATDLLDALIGILPLSFAFVRFNDPEGGPPVEMTRAAVPLESSTYALEIGEALKGALADGPLESALSAPVFIGGAEFSVMSAPLGLQGELGVVVAGCREVDFREQTLALLLDVAASRTAIAVQRARLLSEQKRASMGLDERVAQRTRELATAYEELKKREIESQLIIDGIPGLIALLTATGDVEVVNRHLLEYFGRPIEEIRQWGTNDLLNPEDLPRAIEAFRRSIESGAPYQNEHRLRRSDGVYRWFQSRGFPLRDANGRIFRWCFLLTDIDDRRCAEEAVRASERNLKTIIDTIPALAWSARADGSAEFFNRHYLDYIGLSAEQVRCWSWTAAIHPDDLGGLTATWQRIMASGEPGEAEARMRRFDSAYRWFLFRANPLRDESGRIVKWFGTHVDIEDRKRGEEALRARELSWRQIVDNIPGLVAATGALGEVEFLNRQTLEYFGKTSEELKNWALVDVVHPDELPRVIEAWKESIEAGRIYDVEHRCRRADGVYRWFQVRGLPVRNAEGTITAWYLLLTDIDDRKRAEEALRSSERNLSLLINTIPAMIHTGRPDGYLDYFNRRWLEYLSCSQADVEGWKWTTWIHPDDLKGIVDKWQECLATEEIFEYEARVRRGDGQYRWMFDRKVPLRDEHGKIVRWYGTSLDIEDRKRAEAQVEQAYLRLTEAQRLSKTGSFITDLLVDDHNWSEEAFRIFEFDPATKVTVQTIRDRVHPDDLPSFDAVIALGMTGADVDFVFRIVTSRGAVKHVRGMARLLARVGGRPLFIGALQDVTERKVAEEALDRARSELAHVARVTTLNALTASIAHEINQPLSGIITNASTCLRMLDGEPPNVDGARETARRTLRDGNRAADVIKRLRALFSKKEFTLELLDLNDATGEVIALSLSDLQRNRVILRSELADDLPPVIGDRVQLQQVILNLLRNASDAMVGVQDRPRRLLVKTEREEGDRVRLTVRDAGVGVDSQSMDKLFDTFYTTKSGGMGIGLSVSRSIIERHHGRLWAEPNDGPGATFSFSIPCGPESVTAAAPQ